MSDTANIVESMIEIVNNLKTEMEKFENDETFHTALLHAEELEAELDEILSDSQ